MALSLQRSAGGFTHTKDKAAHHGQRAPINMMLRVDGINHSQRLPKPVTLCLGGFGAAQAFN